MGAHLAVCVISSVCRSTLRTTFTLLALTLWCAAVVQLPGSEVPERDPMPVESDAQAGSAKEMDSALAVPNTTGGRCLWSPERLKHYLLRGFSISPTPEDMSICARS